MTKQVGSSQLAKHKKLNIWIYCTSVETLPPKLEEAFLHFILTVEEANPNPSVLFSIFYTDKLNSIHRFNRSPIRVALILALILFLLYNRVSTFDGVNDSSD